MSAFSKKYLFDGWPEVAKARRRVNKMDRHDGHQQADLPVDMALRTVLIALEASRSSKMDPARRDECFFDAIVMLQQIELKYRGTETCPQ